MNNIPTTIFKDDVFRNLCHHWQEEKRCPLLFLDHFEENYASHPTIIKALKWAADVNNLEHIAFQAAMLSIWDITTPPPPNVPELGPDYYEVDWSPSPS